MTIPKVADDTLYDKIKGPSLGQASVKVSQQIINGTNGLNLMKPWPKDRDGSITIGWNKRAKPMADNSQSKRQEKQRLKS